MRYLLAILTLVLGVVVGLLAYRTATAGPPVVLPAPSRVEALAGGNTLLQDGWTDSTTVDLMVAGRVATAGADVELRPVGTSFSDSATAAVAAGDCKACKARRDPIVTVHLTDGAYHWQARLHNSRGVSPWVRSRGMIRVDTHLPVVGQVASPTDPTPGTTYHSATVQFTWQGSDVGSGVAGYSYRLDSDPHGTALPDVRTSSPSVTLTGLNSGTWYFHVRALDRAGNWGPSVTFPVTLDVTPPGLADVRFSSFYLDPSYQSLGVSFHVTRAARLVRVGVYRQRGGLERLYALHDLRPGQQVSVTWDGKDAHGRPVTSGSYAVYIRAIDAYGHASLRGWNDFQVNYKRIVVSLSQQKLTAYDGSSVFLTSLVTTGNRALPTPTGTYTIMGKFHPFTFRSPWPKSSPFYYPPSLTQWAMLFRAGGYFIHDAPWRSVFGPGSNAAVGKPGSNYTGTHGCVNVPNDVAQKLYAWAPIGTVVQVVP